MLGRLDHPHLARQLQAGCLEDGRPYVVSEYLDGRGPGGAPAARRAAHPGRAGAAAPAAVQRARGAPRARHRGPGAPRRAGVPGRGADPVHPEADRTRTVRRGPAAGRDGGTWPPWADSCGRPVRSTWAGWRVCLPGASSARTRAASPHPPTWRGRCSRPSRARSCFRRRRRDQPPLLLVDESEREKPGRRPRPVPSRADARRGRDGPRLPGAPRQPGAAGGGEGAPGRARPERAPHPALLPRGAGGQPDQPRAHRGDPRLRRGDGGDRALPRLLRDGDARGQEPHRAAGGGSAERGPGGGTSSGRSATRCRRRTRWASSTAT